MIELQFRGLIGEFANLNAAKIGFLVDHLQVVSIASGEVFEFSLGEAELATLTTSDVIGPVGGGIVLTEAAFVDDQIWLWDNFDQRASIYENGRLVPAVIGGTALTVSGTIGSLGGDYVLPSPDQNALSLLSGQNGAFTQLGAFTGGNKDYISDISSMKTVLVDGREFLIAASYDENGLSCFERQGDQIVLIDSIGSKDGIWVSGLTALETAEVAGEVFIVAASANANAIATVRLNAQGVFFPTDQDWDTRDSRFAGVSELATFEWYDRDFVVAGGDDLGLSVMEVLPGGGIFQHGSIAQGLDWGIGGLTSLGAKVVGTEAQVFASGTLGAGVAQVEIDLSRTGDATVGTNADDQLSGGWMDDLISGGAGDDALIGMAGDDVLIDGAGFDVLTGENGADVFVFMKDGSKDKIADFAKGEDRIHLGDWGQIYTRSALQITETPYGAEIAWGDEVLAVFTKNHRPIDLDTWGEDDFIF